MDKFKVKKVDNCFKDSQTYEYKLNEEINEEFLKKLESLGEVEVKDFRRPIFIINGEIKVKGVINTKIIRVSFPDDIWKEKKDTFEKFLNEII